MIMILGVGFIFEMNSLVPNSHQRTRTQKITEHELAGQRNVLQHLGPGSDDITLAGQIFPGHFGTSQSLDRLNAMADTGAKHRLIDVNGQVYDKWMIGDVSETHSDFDAQKKARKIEFTINLRRSG